MRSTIDQEAVSKDVGEDGLAQTSPRSKPMVPHVRVAQSIKLSILLPPRQAFPRVVARALVSEYDTYIMGLRSRRSELSH